MFTDARKSAVTDGLTKAASMIGIGADVFKGLVRVGTGNGRARTSDNGSQLKHDATAFWTLYNTEGKAAGVPIEAAKGLAGKGNWQAAIADLQALISGVKC